MTGTSKKLLLIILLSGIILFVRLSGLHHEISFEKLQENRAALLSFVHDHYSLAVAGYIVLYIVVTGFALPGAAIMTLTGGFLFGMVSVVYSNIGATSGAALAFSASRYLAQEWVRKKYGQRLQTFNEELLRNGHHYLLTLRLIPIVPFFLINIFSGLTTIPFRTFLWTTTLGIVPGSLVYVFAGTRLAALRTVGDIFTLNTGIAFGLLALLSLSPVAVKFLKRRYGRP